MSAPNPNDPTSYPRRILLAVTGLSPQVVTETLHALVKTDGSTPFVPTEVHLITTAEGAQRARLALLSEDPGWFRRLLADYALPQVAFDESRIHCIPGSARGALEDIRDIEDNECAADFITEHVRRLTEDPRAALHVSIAGGRKSMGYYLGYAVSLFGRAQDRLSHVLVSEPFESSWDFFYPTPYSRVITTRDNKLADTADARVTLAEIPFVRMRDGLPERLLSGRASFSATVSAAQRSREPRLEIDIERRRVGAGGEEVHLGQKEFAVYLWLARRASTGCGPLALGKAGDAAAAEEFLDAYLRVGGAGADYDRAKKVLKGGMDTGYFGPARTRVNGALERALGKRAAAPYLIANLGTTKAACYGLEIDPAAIAISGIGGEVARPDRLNSRV